ncbi:hypothetical protein [Myxosarcina sp. GI1]|uniref:hypothetical protein n=1 Tax=Myxosarcina sp. GI1 TaxID=1541065 RepID=UPI0006902E15|nr:hypothetical protein [Myxosarcina sp. GI1]
MSIAQNLVYSNAAAARILNIDPLLIKNLEIWQNIILVRICARRAKFISKKDFCQHFADWRRAEAKT